MVSSLFLEPFNDGPDHSGLHWKIFIIVKPGTERTGKGMF